ncbi:peptidoglycan D,D-transpeptidase FtsI family protein [Thermovibrio ammonificans]
MRPIYWLRELILRVYRFIKPFKEDRLNLFFLFSLALLTVYSVRLLYLTHFDREEWIKFVNRQFSGKIKISYERGEILDRNGSLLAASERVVSFYVRPTEIKDWKLFCQIVTLQKAPLEEYAEEKGVSLEKLYELLKPLKEVTPEELQKAYEKKYTVVTYKGKKIKVPFVWLHKKAQTTPYRAAKAVKVAMRIYYTLSGESPIKKRHPDILGFVPEYKRCYPYGVGSTVVGLASDFDKGLSNLEYYLDKKGIITGKTVLLSGEKDYLGRVYLGKNASQFLTKEKGNNVLLTIDGNLQYIVEKTISEYGKKWHPKFINAVLMDPNTGEILAAASWPFYRYGEKLKKGDTSKLVARYVTDVYEPGSVMKPIVLAAALNEGVVGVNDVFYCPARIKINDRTFTNEFHGRNVKLRAWEIIEYSDNVGIIQVAQKLGKKKLYEYLKRFGFGNKTGIELPIESKGLLSNWKKWKDVEFATITFGYHISVTTLQLAAAYSALVNGGIYYKPFLVKAILDEKGNVIKSFSPVAERRVISERTSKLMRRVLTMVVEGGTAKPTKFENFYVGGKTGTAQKLIKEKGKKPHYSRKKIYATFVGFFPATNPKYVLAVTVNEPKVPKNMLWATKIAVPIFRDIAERVLLYERTAPDKKRYTVEPGGNITATEINTDFPFKNGIQQRKK